jgi:aminocarboxymuconate-semialdehyde decarboxylase
MCSRHTHTVPGRKIDTHHHAFPRQAVEELRRSPAYGVTFDGDRISGLDEGVFTLRPVNFDAEAKIALLAENGLDAAVVSATPPLFLTRLPSSPAIELCRATNAGLAGFQAAEPTRFRWLAVVPMGFPEQAASLLAEAVADGAAGVEIPTNVGGRRYDTPDYDVFWEAVEQVDATVFLHPADNEPHRGLNDWHLGNVIGNLLETTVTAERLWCAGVFDRHPGLRIVLAHAGGFFPFQAGRLRHARTVRKELAAAPEDPWDARGRLLVDSITHDRAALRYLVERMGVENVVLGTDLPAPMAPPDPFGEIEAAVGPEAARQIAEANPARLFRFTQD